MGANMTELEYIADICLKGLRVIYTPFILNALERLTESCREGCKKKAIELWGHAE